MVGNYHGNVFQVALDATVAVTNAAIHFRKRVSISFLPLFVVYSQRKIKQIARCASLGLVFGLVVLKDEQEIKRRTMRRFA